MKPMCTHFSLALGGGASRGFAHIGVISRLDELGVKPGAISGTSIGSIIGAFYASGWNGKQMQKLALGLKIMKLVDIDLKTGLFKGNRIMRYLEKNLGDITFDSLQIPLAIVATDIDTGKKVIFREGKVLDAIRASISIPGIFRPHKYDGMRLVDGGLVENLPISVLPKDVPVIAVSVQMDVEKCQIPKSDFFPDGTIFSNSALIFKKVISIMMIQNETQSIKDHPDVFLLRPGREDIDFYDFRHILPLIEAGYECSVKLHDFLSPPCLYS